MEYTEQEQKTSLPFFGIPRILPYVRPYRGMLAVMILCGLGGT